MSVRKIVSFYDRAGNYQAYFFPEVGFSIDTTGYNPSGIVCTVCKKRGQIEGRACVEIDQTYVKIILNLKRANLLDMSYPLMCCRCFSTRKMEKEYAKL